MCGIVYIRGEKEGIVEKLIKHYKAQKSRGVEGFGFVCADNNRIVYKRAQYEHEIKKKLKHAKGSADILFHHRYPTSTENILEAAHPIKVSNKELEYDYYVVHNGVISNCDTLKDKHEELGYKYNTEVEKYIQVKNKQSKRYITGSEYNDSESLAIELARYNEGLSGEIGARGSIAFIMLQVEKRTQKPIYLHYGRNSGNPLGWTKDGDHMVLASLGVQSIAQDMYFTYSYHTQTTTVKECTIGTQYYPTYTGGTATTYGTKYDSYRYNSDDYDYRDTYCTKNTATVGLTAGQVDDDIFMDSDGTRYRFEKDGQVTELDNMGVDDSDEYESYIVQDQIDRAFEIVDEIEAMAELYKAPDELSKYWGEAIVYLDRLCNDCIKDGRDVELAEYIDYKETCKAKLHKLNTKLLDDIQA